MNEKEAVGNGRLFFMPKSQKKKAQLTKKPHRSEMTLQVKPTGAVRLRKRRMALVASQWKKFASSLRQIDEVSIGDAEPATFFVWKKEKI